VACMKVVTPRVERPTGITLEPENEAVGHDRLRADRHNSWGACNGGPLQALSTGGCVVDELSIL
jgi:hypothetical protein